MKPEIGDATFKLLARHPPILYAATHDVNDGEVRETSEQKRTNSAAAIRRTKT
jgi:hypothetical protein